MSKRHNFNQEEILSLAHPSRHDQIWNTFKQVIKELDLNIRVTGGVVLTHEINCDSADFDVIKTLIR